MSATSAAAPQHPPQSSSSPSSAAAAASSSREAWAGMELRLLTGALGARDMFLANYGQPQAPEDPLANRVRIGAKLAAEYGMLPEVMSGTGAPKLAPAAAAAQTGPSPPERISGKKRRQGPGAGLADVRDGGVLQAEEDEDEMKQAGDGEDGAVQGMASSVSTALVEVRQQQQLVQKQQQQNEAEGVARARALDEKLARIPEQYRAQTALVLRRKEQQAVRPTWHAPWQLMRVITGGLGWVRAVAVDPGNEIFYSGSSDGTITVWDLASGERLNTLTGHISAVRGLAVCPNLNYLLSASEDKNVMVWDLHKNRIAMKLYGHMNGVYCVAVHPTLDNVVVSGGRDSSVRVWDVRQPQPVVNLTGHTNTVCSVALQNTQPQLISGSHDTTIRCWDLRKPQGATDILTHHKKGVRALGFHHAENTFMSGAADNIKVWRCPRAAGEKVTFYRNLSGHNSILNALAINQDNVLVSGGDDGSLKFWDWDSGHCFQTVQSQVQPGSLDGEAAILSMAFDMTGSRLITGEGDKTIKVWREDPEATEESHPLDWQPQKRVKMF